MASDLQPTSYVTLTSAATFAPPDRATSLAPRDPATTFAPPQPRASAAGPDVTGTLLERPAAARTVITPAPSELGRAFGLATEAPSPTLHPVVPTAGNPMLRTRLFILDLVAAILCWGLLGLALTTSSTTAGRVLPGVAGGVVTLVAMRGAGLYRSRMCVRRSAELLRVVAANLLGVAAFVLVEWSFATPGVESLVCGGACIVAVAACRSQYGRWLRACRARGQYLRNVILVGTNEDAVALRTMLRSEPELGYAVTGVVGDAHTDPAWSDVPNSGSVANIPNLAAATGANGILIVPYAISSATIQQAIGVAANAGLHVQLWPGLRGVGSPRLRHVPVSGEAFFYVEPKRRHPWQLAVKRAIDVVVSAAALLVFSPFIAVAAILIKLEDHGPVFHQGARVGMDGREFMTLKLRSMRVADPAAPTNLEALNERTDGPLFKASNDPRVTRVGRFIRASSIDELPQLWNVLMGTMSLVGPRPALPSEVLQFDPELQRRHSVRPGITGLWQVEARHNPSFNAYRRLDLRYVDNWSLWLDLSILVATVPSVLSQAVHAFSKSKRRTDD